MRPLSICVLVSAAFGSPVLAGPQSGAPSNDSWVRAVPIDGDNGFFWNTNGSTPDGQSSCDVGESKDVWFVYTPEDSGAATAFATTFGSPPQDIVLSLHTLDTQGTLSTAGCDDEGGGTSGFQCRITWTANGGDPYYVRVTGKNGSTGSFQFSVLGPQGIIPPNASRAAAMPICPGEYHGYTRNMPGPIAFCTYTEDAWFAYAPSASGMATVSTCSAETQYDTSLQIQENGVEIICTDNVDCGDLEIVTFPVQAGSTYLIRVGSLGASSGVYALSLQGPDCVGQTCADAETIDEGSYLFSLEGASSSGLSSCSSTDPTHYFRYVASADGTLNVSTCSTATSLVQGYAVEAKLSLHLACPADPTTELDCSTGSIVCSESGKAEPWVSTPVVADQEILIRVGASSDGQLGPILLDVELAQQLASMCFGDGSGAPCPCENNGAPRRGCENSLGTGGARLFATGVASLSDDTLSLISTSAPGNAPLLLLQANAPKDDGAGAPFADGLLCLDGEVRRLSGALSVQGAAAFGLLRGQTLSGMGGPILAGSTRWYQAYYRNHGSFCTPAPANLTNAVSVTWLP